ncbi:prepilin peptidase [Mesobacterium sp. TK19101]|uniref:Prepilin peptidase n=1 Tax=Mesobacterium hydrothermale TaxID=3111907 RepID=A0ABU6HI42_9RHOB|nr:prepilin peptidase [Mesobacterium sp. TK19101]MEC3862001.1 prepilin peptidase [Mesobacterium sp. TK19101]
MALSPSAALWFLPFVLPICLYVCYTDMSRMKITNRAVMVLIMVFAIVGPLVLPFDTYLWRYAHLGVALLAGILLNAAGAMGAGDAKFIAAAAPFVNLGDLPFLMILFSITLIVAFVTHRVVRASPLRQLAPNWASWTSGKRFPMGLALGGTLGLYLTFGALQGL